MTKTETATLIKLAKNMCEKFVGKVEDGRARSIETYADCRSWLDTYKKAKETDG